MSTYVYFPSDGVTRLEANTPIGESEPGSVLDEAVRQIKAYLMDGIEGPDKKISDLITAIGNTTVASGLSPVGTVMAIGTSTVPPGFLAAHGQSVSRTTYAALFAVIGTTFGSVNASSFNLPDCRSVVIAGMDSTQTEFQFISKFYGTPAVALTLAQVASHKCEWPLVDDSTNGLLAVGPNTSIATQPFQWRDGGPYTTGYLSVHPPSGGGKAHNNVQPSISVNYIIKT